MEKEIKMANLLEMAAEIVASHASTTALSKDDLLNELQEVYKALQQLEKGEEVSTESAAEEAGEPMISRKKAFGKNQVVCMICGKGMKTLTRHLRTTHKMTPKEYRQQFDIPRNQPLAARAYSESRRQMALDRGLGENLAKARAAKARGKKK